MIFLMASIGSSTASCRGFLRSWAVLSSRSSRSNRYGNTQHNVMKNASISSAVMAPKLQAVEPVSLFDWNWRPFHACSTVNDTHHDVHSPASVRCATRVRKTMCRESFVQICLLDPPPPPPPPPSLSPFPPSSHDFLKLKGGLVLHIVSERERGGVKV